MKDVNLKLSSNIYNSLFVLKIYCEYFKKTEEIDIIIPIINYLLCESDKLYSNILNSQNKN